uniref:Uncharacterized protein n=1 Tax=Oryza brachyantha TaxID=4533 RepID=J3LZS5_ORYBR
MLQLAREGCITALSSCHCSTTSFSHANKTGVQKAVRLHISIETVFQTLKLYVLQKC